MPNRILRDWTDSFTINTLDVHSERFFTRLIMKVDDFGAFHADTRLLKSYLFPLLPDIRETDITRWLAACEKAGLVRCYVDDKSRKYLQIINFKQRMRQQVAKFPQPNGAEAASGEVESGDGLPDDGQLTDDCPPDDGEPPLESETNPKENTISKPKKNTHPPSSDVARIFNHWQSALNHPTAKLTNERKRKVEARLKEGYSVAQIIEAIDGCASSPFHRGQNAEGQVWDDLELICRTGSKLEGFIARQTLKKNGHCINAANSTPDEFAAEVQRIHDSKYGPVIEMEAIQ